MLAALHKLTKLAQLRSGHDAALGRLFTTVTGLPIAQERAEAREHEQLLASLRPLLDENRFGDLIAAAENERTVSSFSSDGLPKFALFLSLLDELADPNMLAVEDCEAALPRLQKWWNDADRNPSSCAALALAMARTGYAYDAHKSSWLSGSRYKDLRVGYNHVAQEVFADGTDGAVDCYLWHRNQVRFAILEGATQHEIGRRFHLALQFERYDIPLYLERAASFVPGDDGTNEDLEIFAHACVARTRDRFGMMMYARIYSVVCDLKDLTVLDIDRHLLMKGFGDWFQHFPTQYLANRYAAIAHLTGDLDKVRELFTHHICELHQNAWFNAAQPYSAWYEAGLSSDDRRAVA